MHFHHGSGKSRTPAEAIWRHHCQLIITVYILHLRAIEINANNIYWRPCIQNASRSTRCSSGIQSLSMPIPEWPLAKIKQEFLGRTNRLLSLRRHGPHWNRRVQQFFYCSVCIRYRGSVSTELLPSSDRGIFTEPLPSSDRGYIYTHAQTAGPGTA
jgi:hypothetical protein